MNYKLYADIQNGEYGFWTAPTKNKPSSFVSLGPAVMIKKITENIETEEVKLKLAIEYMGRNKSITIPRDELSDNRLIQSLNKIGAKCPKHHFDILVESIMRQESELEEEGYIPSKVYSNLGWIFVPEYDETGSVVQRSLHYRSNKLIGSIRARYNGSYDVARMGDFDVWRQMVIDRIIGHPPLELVLLASLSAIINGLISPVTTGENPIFHLCGPSGCGKTTALYAATSVFGVPYEGENRKIGVKGDISTHRSIYGSWGATENATTIQCTGNKGAVIIFNELGKFDGRDMSKIVYNLSEGTDKVRLDRQMTAYTSESYATSIISSGEISLLDRCTNKATGLQIRVFEICDKLTDTPDQSHSIKETCRENNGWAAPILAQYILDSGGINFALPIFKNYCQSLPSVLPQNATSARFIEKFAALIMTTADIARDALNLPFDTDGILQYLSNHEAMTGNKRNVLADSYRIVIEACSTNKTCFFRKGEPDPSIKSYGRITTPNAMLPDGRLVIEEYEIRRSFLEEVLHKNGFTNPTACYKEWRSMGVLDFEQGKFTRGRKIDPTSEKEENVFVLRVFGTAPPAPKTPPKCKLVQNKSHKAASKIADLLDDKDEEVEENA